MRLTAVSAILALAISSVAAHAVTISVTGVGPQAVSTGGSPDDTIQLYAVPTTPATNVAIGGVFVQQGNFQTGFVYTQPDDPFTFSESFTVNGITHLLTFSGDDDVTNAADTLTIDPLGAVAFGSVILTFDGVSNVAPNYDEGNPFELDAHVSAGKSAPSPTPEPSSVALLGTGLLSLAGAARRRLKR
jgi:PEP-CTERM motif